MMHLQVGANLSAHDAGSPPGGPGQAGGEAVGFISYELPGTGNHKTLWHMPPKSWAPWSHQLQCSYHNIKLDQ